MATCIHPSGSCLPPIPLFPLLNRIHLLIFLFIQILMSVKTSLLPVISMLHVLIPLGATCAPVTLALKEMEEQLAVSNKQTKVYSATVKLYTGNV